MNNTLPIVVLSFIPILIVIILIYVFTRTFKQLGAKTTNEELLQKKFYQVYYGYFFDWLKKYWYIIVPSIIVFIALHFYFYYFFSLRYLAEGILFVLLGILIPIANYKQYRILTNTMFYRLAREAGTEHRVKIYFYVITPVLLIFGLFLIFYSLLVQ